MSGGAKLRPAKGTAVILRSERGYYTEIRVEVPRCECQIIAHKITAT